MRTALRSLRCDSALMSALQRLSERGIDADSARARGAGIASGTDTLGFSTIRPLRKLLPQCCLGQPLRRPGWLLRNDKRLVE